MYFFLFLIGFFVAEVMVISQVGEAIGGLAAFGLLVLGALVGGWLIKRQGVRSQQAFLAGGMPGGSSLDALFGLLAGLLFIFPGFISDFLALLLLIPPVRLLLLAGIGTFLLKRLLPRMQGVRFGRFQMPGQDGFDGFGEQGGFDGFNGNGSGFERPGKSGGFYGGSRQPGCNGGEYSSDDTVIEGEFRDVTEETRAHEAAAENPGGQGSLPGNGAEKR